MLSKLLKHEFRATARVMLPLYALMAVLAGLARVSVYLLDHQASKAVHWFAGLGVGLFILSVLVVTVMAVVLMVNRFYKNFMTDEGYVMFTLPVTANQLVFSKIIVSVVWFIATAAADAAALTAAFANSHYIRSAIDLVRMAFEKFTTVDHVLRMHITGYAAEGVVIGLLAMIATCLVVYASISVGHSFANHKVLLSFVAFGVFTTVLEIAGIALLISVIGPAFERYFMMVADGFAAAHTVLLTVAGAELLVSVVFYFLTYATLKRRLNMG